MTTDSNNHDAYNLLVALVFVSFISGFASLMFGIWIGSRAECDDCIINDVRQMLDSEPQIERRAF